MFVKTVGVLVGTLFFLQNVSGQSCICKCGPTGLFGIDDLYGKPAHPGPLVVRPKTLAKPISLPLLGSFNKGPCYRKQAIVKPAVVPRPVYIQSEATCANGNSKLAAAVAAAAQILAESSSCSSSATNLAAQSLAQGAQGIDVSSAYARACASTHPPAPADAVSLAIAYKQSQNCFRHKIAEDKLAYGFRKLPIELPQHKVKVCKRLLPEDNLYSLNGQIVELKAVSEQPTCDSLSEEAQEELLDLAISEEAKDVPCARRPSLGELGYGPAKISSPTFVEVPSVSVPEIPVPEPVGVAVPCNDGFKSGTVEYRDVSKHERIPVVVENLSCESAEEPVRHIPIPAPSCQCNYNGNIAGLVQSFSSLAKSSASSSSSSQNSNIIFQKLCS